MSRAAARAASLAMAVVAAVVGTTGSAVADPAGPTDFRSRVTEVTGTDEVEAVVFGGDAFLGLAVEPGVEVVVPGYGRPGTDPEPYLRFAPDGTVEANLRSPTYHLNRDRYQDVEVPPDAAADAPPRWVVVADGGTYAWHDHRIHFMGVGTPPSVDPGGGPQTVFGWEVPIVVDGRPAAVRGELTWLPPPSPALPVVVAVAAAGLVVALGVRALQGRSGPRPGTAVAGAVLGVALAAALVGGAGYASAPPGADVSPSLVVFSATAVAAAAGGWWLLGRDDPRGPVVVAGAGAALVAWGIGLGGVLVRAVVPVGDPVVVRVTVAAALGAGTGALAVVALRWRHLVDPEASRAAEPPPGSGQS